MLMALSTTGSAAGHTWKTGRWAARGADGSLVVETARDLLNAEPPAGDDLRASAGTAVQYALEARTLYVLDAEGHERALKLRSVAAKYSDAYTGVGGGHLLKSVAPGGTQVTLEDGSRWDIEETRHFAVAEWQPDDLITVRRDASAPEFAFTVDNTTQDDGAQANYRVR